MNLNNIIIPSWHSVDTNHIIVEECGESLIKLDTEASHRIIYEPKYYKRNIPGAISHCYMRESVYNKLYEALNLLPNGFGFKIFDAWRPFAVQEFLYNEQVNKLINKSGLSYESAQEKAKKFVSCPSKDASKPYVHATGGAIDLTIVNKQQEELNMGTEFDDFSCLAETNSYELSEKQEVKHNRRLLYYVMTSVGFTNYPSEWWHYDYGDVFWASEKSINLSFYGGIF